MTTILTIAVVVFLLLGVGTLFWGSIGVGRSLLRRFVRPRPTSADRIERGRVAVLMAAHNEEAVISASLRAAKVLVPAANIHVISDGSADATAELAAAEGARVLELSPNRGKAGALAAGIEHFSLADEYDVVLLLDADTRLAEDYFDRGLPLFDDPEVVAVAGHARSTMDAERPSWRERALIAHRERVYAVVQWCFKYGQAAKGINAVQIVPGFASMYRAAVLPEIDIAAEGLVIEDFNMTFEVHRRRLGRIAYIPGVATAFTQDPDTLGDYSKQLRRWTLGFWQTVRRHGPHLGRFWFFLGWYVVELVLASLAQLLLWPGLLVSAVSGVWGLNDGADGTPADIVAAILPFPLLALGALGAELFLTLVAALALRRPSIFLFSPVFPLLRIVDAFICLRSLAVSSTSSDGRWASPTRRVNSGRHRA